MEYEWTCRIHGYWEPATGEGPRFLLLPLEASWTLQFASAIACDGTNKGSVPLGSWTPSRYLRRAIAQCRKTNSCIHSNYVLHAITIHCRYYDYSLWDKFCAHISRGLRQPWNVLTTRMSKCTVYSIPTILSDHTHKWGTILDTMSSWEMSSLQCVRDKHTVHSASFVSFNTCNYMYIHKQ